MPHIAVGQLEVGASVARHHVALSVFVAEERPPYLGWTRTQVDIGYGYTARLTIYLLLLVISVSHTWGKARIYSA